MIKLDSGIPVGREWLGEGRKFEVRSLKIEMKLININQNSAKEIFFNLSRRKRILIST